MSMPIDTITTEISDSKLQIANLTDETLADSGFYWREKSDVRVLICRALEEKGFVNGFSTRLGGVSDFPKNALNLAGYDEDSAENIAENRRRFLQVFGGDFRLASCWQVHSADVRVVKDFEEARDGDFKMDALVSNARRVLLGVKTADCVPILIGDLETESFAAIHAGWRGTANSIVKNAIEKMRALYNSNPKDFVCAIGPAATCRNYEIGEEVIEAFRKNIPDSERFFTAPRDGHAFVDLHQANKEQLLGFGVLPENIFTAPFCTMERTDLFFSYRREKKLFGKTGRLMSVIGRR